MRTLLMASAALALACSPALAQETTGSTMGHAMSPESLTWMPAPAVFPKGAQIAVLSGDPTKSGPFAIRLKFPADYKVPAHQHPTAEVVTVISGTFGFGMGDKLNEANAQTLGPGGFVDLPAKMNHYAFARGDGAVVQVNSTGPFAITYADPADDPTKSQ